MTTKPRFTVPTTGIYRVSSNVNGVETVVMVEARDADDAMKKAARGETLKPLTKKERSLAEEYLICKQRGHEEDYDAPSIEIAGQSGYKHQCVYCKCYFWNEDVLHEDNVPKFSELKGGQ